MTDPRHRRLRQIAGLAVAALVLASACDSAATHGSAPPGGGAQSPGPASTAGAPGGPPSDPASASSSSQSAAASASAPPPLAPPPLASPTSAPGDPDPAKFGFAAKGLRGEVMAFVTAGQVDAALARLDLAATSTIVFFSLTAGSNGGIVPGTSTRIWDSTAVGKLIERAHASGTKVVFSLSRFSWSPAQTKSSVALLGSAKARARLATEVADEVVRRGVDGVNVDFEPIPRGQSANFTDLIRGIRSELDTRDPGLQLTFDVVGHFESYDVGAALAPGGADAVFLMGYHYAGTFSSIAHGTAPLGGPRYDVADAIRGLLKVARPAQLIVGVPYYGHLWPTTSGALNARTTGDGYDVPYEQARVIGARRGTSYDPVEQVRRVAWRQRSCPSCALHWVQLYYDDARSLDAKWTALRRLGLLGTGVWTSAFEGANGELTKALRTVWLSRG